MMADDCEVESARRRLTTRVVREGVTANIQLFQVFFIRCAEEVMRWRLISREGETLPLDADEDVCRQGGFNTSCSRALRA